MYRLYKSLQRRDSPFVSRILRGHARGRHREPVPVGDAHAVHAVLDVKALDGAHRRRGSILREYVVLGRISGPLPPAVASSLLLSALDRSDSVTRDRPMALSVRAAQSETRNAAHMASSKSPPRSSHAQPLRATRSSSMPACRPHWSASDPSRTLQMAIVPWVAPVQRWKQNARC